MRTSTATPQSSSAINNGVARTTFPNPAARWTSAVGILPGRIQEHLPIHTARHGLALTCLLQRAMQEILAPAGLEKTLVPPGAALARHVGEIAVPNGARG